MSADAPRAAMHDGALLGGQLVLAGRLDARLFALLGALHASGSLHKAARAAGYSYKGAWLALDAAGNLARTPLVERRTGGRGGGGSALSAAAVELLAVWRELQARHAGFLREQEAWLANHLQSNPALAGLLKRSAMKTSARNQFVGTVAAIQRGTATCQVLIDIGGGQQIAVAITTESAQAMTLKKGQEALALVKASEVVLVTDFGGWRLSARNQLAGSVARVHKGAVTSMIGLTLPGGATITASVTNDAAEALALAVGQPATACFKAYAVMLAVPG